MGSEIIRKHGTYFSLEIAERREELLESLQTLVTPALITDPPGTIFIAVLDGAFEYAQERLLREPRQVWGKEDCFQDCAGTAVQENGGTVMVLRDKKSQQFSRPFADAVIAVFDHSSGESDTRAVKAAFQLCKVLQRRNQRKSWVEELHPHIVLTGHVVDIPALYHKSRTSRIAVDIVLERLLAEASLSAEAVDVPDLQLA